MDIQKELESVTKNYRALNPKIQERLNEIDPICKISFEATVKKEIDSIKEAVAILLTK